MNEKHLRNRIDQCLKISELSSCPRRKFGALLLDPDNNIVLIDGWNGPVRGPEKLCDGDVCARDKLQIPSGKCVEIGCIHAEQNVIINAARVGVSTNNKWLICTGEPCFMCSKQIYQSGIKKVIIINGGYAVQDGIDFLTKHDVIVEKFEIDGHKDIGR